MHHLGKESKAREKAIETGGMPQDNNKAYSMFCTCFSQQTNPTSKIIKEA